MAASSSGIFSISRLSPFSRMRRSQSAIVVRLRRPRKSNLTSPIFSMQRMSSWVMTAPERGSRYSGTKSIRGLVPITTPAAWVEACRVSPSRRCAVSNSFAIWPSESTRERSSADCSRASGSVMPRVSGTSLAMRSTSAYGMPMTRPTSRITARACSFPKVMI